MNLSLINQFNLLIKQIKIEINKSHGKEKNINTFRLASIKKVVSIIKNFKSEITSVNQVINIKGIGKNSLKRIDEILKTGKLSEIKLEQNHNTYLDSINNLTKIFGIGHKKAHELVTTYDIKSISDLKEKYKKGTIELPENISKGLKYVDKIKMDIPREEIDDIYVYLFKKIIEFDIYFNLIICGSYRRLNKVSGDIDIILYHTNIITKTQAESSNKMSDFINILIKNKFIIDYFTSPDVPTKFMGICKYENSPYRRIDIRLIPMESLYTAILYFTGSKKFNKKMRGIAVTLGYTLNEYWLTNKYGKKIKVDSEKDIFDKLGMEYLDPEDRI